MTDSDSSSSINLCFSRTKGPTVPNVLLIEISRQEFTYKVATFSGSCCQTLLNNTSHTSPKVVSSESSCETQHPETLEKSTVRYKHFARD